MIVLDVDEARRPKAERLARAGGEVVGLELVVLPVKEVLPLRRDAEHATAGEVSLQHQGPFTRGRVDAIEIRRGTFVIVDIFARVAADRPDAVFGDVDVAHRFVRELHVT